MPIVMCRIITMEWQMRGAARPAPASPWKLFVLWKVNLRPRCGGLTLTKGGQTR